MSRGRLQGLARGGLGLLISLVSLFLVVRSVDLGRTWDVMRSANPAWLGLAVVALGGDVILRGLRWQRLIAPIHRVAYGRLLAYMLVGYLANNVLPARLGELVRSHYLGDREGISRTTTLGTVVVERVVDAAVLVAIAAVAILVLQVRGVVASAVLVGLAIVGLLMGGLALAVAAHRLPGADRARELVARWPRARELVTKLRGGLAVAALPRTLAEAVFLSCLAWACTVVAFAAAGQAVGIQLTTGEAALLAAGTNLATAIPSGPGYLGTFELAGVRIAAVFGIGADPALALTVLIHAGSLLLTSAGGAVALVRLGWRPSQAATRSREPMARADARPRRPGRPDDGAPEILRGEDRQT
ncbi:MAG: lysylphosphatidylglycerol synthase transmembrane domain-containing protein [Candidatus Limnocylindrales bacterium]